MQHNDDAPVAAGTDEQKEPTRYWLRGDPLLRNLEGDGRYKRFLRKMNLPE